MPKDRLRMIRPSSQVFRLSESLHYRLTEVGAGYLTLSTFAK